MKKLWILLAAVVLTVSAFAQFTRPVQTAPYVPDEVLVKFTPGSEYMGILMSNWIGGQPVDQVRDLGVYVVKLPAGVTVSRALSFYTSHWFVEYAEPNYLYFITLHPPNDTHYGVQWALPKIQWQAIWHDWSGLGVRAAVLDTGIQSDHPDLSGQVVAARNFTSSNANDVNDRNGHGTHVSGTVAAKTNNGLGVASVAYRSRLVIGKVLDNSGAGTASWISNGILWASDPGGGNAKVINMSFGSYSNSSTIQNAVRTAWSRGAVLVAAAGNDNTSAPLYPAAYSEVIAVGATDQNDLKASFSNFGNWVEVAAPGVSIASTYPRNRYVYASGTSMSSPHVAGLAALILEKNPGFTNSQVRSRIQATSDPVGGWVVYGRINAWRALNE